MADAEDREKAEKVAAARKRYEQLKKQKAKKAHADKKENKDKADNEEGTAGKDDSKLDENTTEEAADDKIDASVRASDEPSVEHEASAEQDAPTESEGPTGTDDGTEASLYEQSRIRSESFKRGNSQISVSTTGLKLGPLSPGGDAVADLYKKQALRIDQLEKNNKRLEKEAEDKDRILTKVEAEVEELREAQADTADLRVKASKSKDTEAELERQKNEISTLERQNSVLQSQVKDKRRQSSTAVPASPDDLSTQLTAKINTIESLELEISNLRHSLFTAESNNTSLTTRIDSLESSLATAETSASTAQQELSTLRAASSTSTEPTDSDAASADATRIRLLTSDLQAAQRTATDATVRAATLEKKIETLTTLHRESEVRSATQAAGRTRELERLRHESAEMRAKLTSQSSENARLRASSVTSGSHFDGAAAGLTGDEALQARIRDLEAEIHDLRSGAWRERRMELQGDEMAGADDEENGGGGYGGGGYGGGSSGGGVRSPAKSVYDDVDLNAPTTPAFSRTRSSPYGAFANVLSAFTEVAGTATAAGSAFLGNLEGSNSGGGRRQSMRGHQGGFFGGGGNGGTGPEELEDEEDDLEFDEDAFRAAQEEEGRKRLERVREVKRGLKEWEGWRVDIVDLRGGVAAGVFDV